MRTLGRCLSVLRAVRPSPPRFLLPVDGSRLCCLLATPRHRAFCSSAGSDDELKKPLGIVKKFHQMWKDYWYVLIPVHVVTSIGWYGGFYLLCKSGVDVPQVLGFFGASNDYLEKVRDSNVGYFALAYACYKIATPVRYTVSVGGTTISIRYLRDWGYLKTSSDLRTQIQDRGTELRENMDERKAELKSNLDEKRTELQARTEEWSKAWQKFAEKRRKQK